MCYVGEVKTKGGAKKAGVEEGTGAGKERNEAERPGAGANQTSV